MKCAALAIALAGCAGPTPYECEGVPDWHFERPPECVSVRHNRTLAASILGQLEEGVSVYVYASRGVRGFDGVAGQYDITEGVLLNCDGLSLVHEWQHMREWRAGEVGTAWHQGWAGNGNDERDQRFKNAAWVFHCEE